MKGFSISRNPRRLGLKAFSLLLVLALLTASLPVVALAAPSAATCARNYTVQSGDTLSKISVTYDVSIAELATANNLKEPYTLYIGQQLCIPGSTTTTTTTSSSSSSSSSEKLTITLENDKIVVKVSGLTKNSAFVIKGMKYDRGDTSWIKFGNLKTDKKGNGSVTLKLPKHLREGSYLVFCVKNLLNDKVECQRIRK